jgi:hypothetical protein
MPRVERLFFTKKIHYFLLARAFEPIIFYHFFNAKGGKLIFHQENSLFSHGKGL